MVDDAIRIGLAILAAALSGYALWLRHRVSYEPRQLVLGWVAPAALAWAIFETVAALGWFTLEWRAWLSRAAVMFTLVTLTIVLVAIRDAEQ